MDDPNNFAVSPVFELAHRERTGQDTVLSHSALEIGTMSQHAVLTNVLVEKSKAEDPLPQHLLKGVRYPSLASGVRKTTRQVAEHPQPTINRAQRHRATIAGDIASANQPALQVRLTSLPWPSKIRSTSIQPSGDPGGKSASERPKAAGARVPG